MFVTIADSFTSNSIHEIKELSFTPFSNEKSVLRMTKKELFNDFFGMSYAPHNTLTVKCEVTAIEKNYENVDKFENRNKYMKNEVSSLLRMLLLFTIAVFPVIYICLYFSMPFIGHFLPLPENIVIIMTLVLTYCFLIIYVLTLWAIVSIICVIKLRRKTHY